MEKDALEQQTMRKVTLRLLPFLTLCYLLAFIDRSNIGMAALQMNADLGLSSEVFGLGASLFFIGYFVMEVPSNVMLDKVGARLWICRIMVSWGLLSALMATVRGPTAFYLMRFLLGAAEAGFFPGVVLYLSRWMPRSYRSRTLALFAIAIPFSSFVGSPLSGLLLSLSGQAGLHGWQWLFLCEGVPTAVLGLTCLKVLTDRPEQAHWLRADEKAWLLRAIDAGTHHEKPRGHWADLLRSASFWSMAIACCGASAAGSVLSVWQPQILKAFGLSDLQTGLVSAVPYGLACVAMVLWGLHSDMRKEVVWHTVLPLGLIVLGLVGQTVISGLSFTLFLLSCMLAGAYCFKGPFWSMASAWLSPREAAVGIAGINAVSNLIGGGLMVNVYAQIHRLTANTALALLPIAILNIAGIAALLRAERSARAREAADGFGLAR